MGNLAHNEAVTPCNDGLHVSGCILPANGKTAKEIVTCSFGDPGKIRTEQAASILAHYCPFIVLMQAYSHYDPAFASNSDGEV